MINVRKRALDAIIQSLGFIEITIGYSGGIHLYDTHVIAEHFFESFLNSVYQIKLVNLNNGAQQQPAIDLGDASSGICFQVTSDGKKAKIRKTVDRYLAYHLVSTFPHLRVLIIGRRQGKYAGITVPNGVTFDVDKDILDCAELVRHINTLGTPELLHLESIIYQELPVFRQATDVQKQSDAVAINEYRSFFDRPALLDPWNAEADYSAFGKALTDLIQLMNTGWVEGMPVTKKRMKIENATWKQSLATITAKLIALRQIFTIHVRSGEIDTVHNQCAFKDCGVPQFIDGYKQAILSEMNSLLTTAGFPKIT